jgi:hypothetical protein
VSSCFKKLDNRFKFFGVHVLPQEQKNYKIVLFYLSGGKNKKVRQKRKIRREIWAPQ